MATSARSIWVFLAIAGYLSTVVVILSFPLTQGLVWEYSAYLLFFGIGVWYLIFLFLTVWHKLDGPVWRSLVSLLWSVTIALTALQLAYSVRYSPALSELETGARSANRQAYAIQMANNDEHFRHCQYLDAPFPVTPKPSPSQIEYCPRMDKFIQEAQRVYDSTFVATLNLRQRSQRRLLLYTVNNTTVYDDSDLGMAWGSNQRSQLSFNDDARAYNAALSNIPFLWAILWLQLLWILVLPTLAGLQLSRLTYDFIATLRNAYRSREHDDSTRAL